MNLPSLINLHFLANDGVYFSAREQYDGNLFFVHSDTIPDSYWSYGYRADGTALSTEQIVNISRIAQGIGRAPAIWQASGQSIPEGWHVVSTECWMTLRSDGSCVEDPRQIGLEFKVSDVPAPEMIDTFADSYGDGPADESVGYASLPPEYVETYTTGRPKDPAVLHHIGAYQKGICVAVATITFVGEYVGLYSVGVAHSFRSRGIGVAVSSRAIQLAFEGGAREVFLQTEAGSPVERMYKSIGFRTIFEADLLEKS